MGPGDRLALGIEAGRDAIIVIRPVHVVLDVFLAAPEHLHRAGDLFRDLHGPGDEIHLEPPAEAAAQEMVVHVDLGLRQPGHFGGGVLSEGRDLGSHPDVAAVRPDVDGAVHRLHSGVREERLLVDRLDLLSGAGHRRGDIAILARDNSRFLRRRCQLLHDVGGRQVSVRPVVPTNVERGQALFRRPRIGGDHGHRVVEAHHLLHARNGLRLGVVDARDLAAEHGTGGHRGELHAGEPHVDAELCRAVDLVGSIESLRRRADQLEVLGVLEGHAARHGKERGAVDESTVRQAAAGRSVHHHAVRRTTRAGLDLPGLRRGGHEHGARGGPGATQRLPVAAHRRRAARFLNAEQWLGVQRVVGGRVLEPDLAEIDFQLLGEQHRHRRVGPLPHFHLVHDERDAAVAVDADEPVGLEFACRLRAGSECRADARGQTEAHEQTAAGGGARSQEGPAGQGMHRSRN